MQEDRYYLELEENGYYNTIDKRSKDYREYKQWLTLKQSGEHKKIKENIENKSKGLGDTIAKITKATGIDKAVKFIAGEDCGCDERQSKLNEIWRYKNIQCISEEDYIYLDNFFKGRHTSVTNQQKINLIQIYNSVFNTNQSTKTSCSSCIAKIVKNLKRYLEVYK
jgi:hypothetical protein